MPRELVATDSSALISWINLENYPEVDHVEQLQLDGRLVLAGAVLTEAASGPQLAEPFLAALQAIPLLTVFPGYWWRAGELRAKAKAKGRKARLGDALIAQACIDADVPLLTRDADFKVFVAVGGLRLYEAS